MKDTVLLVEDDDTLCELSLEMFKIIKTPLLVSQNPEEAERVFDQNKDKISIIIFDMNLDDATGVDVFNILKEKGESFTAILASGMFLEDDKQTYLDMGFSEVIAKPYNMAELKRIIKAYISL